MRRVYPRFIFLVGVLRLRLVGLKYPLITEAVDIIGIFVISEFSLPLFVNGYNCVLKHQGRRLFVMAGVRRFDSFGVTII